LSIEQRLTAEAAFGALVGIMKIIWREIMVFVRVFTICFFLFGGWAGAGIAAAGSGAGDAASPHILPALKKIPVFQSVDAAQLQKLSGITETAVLEAGTRVIEQGKRTRKMVIASDSEVRIEIDGALVTLLPPGSLVGEIEFLEGVPATADVVLVDRSRVLIIEHAKLRSLMDANPDLGYRLMYEIAKMEANRLRMRTQGKSR